MIERLYINEMKKELKYSDRRSVLKYCHNNGVAVFSDTGSNKQYVLKAEFDFMRNKEVIAYLKAKYTEDILTAFFGLKIGSGNEIALPLNEQHNKVTRNQNRGTKYQPQGLHEKNFLNHLQNI